MLQIVQESFEKGEISEAEKDRRKKGIFKDTRDLVDGVDKAGEMFNRVSITQGNGSWGES